MTQTNNPIRAAIWMVGAMLSFTLMAVGGRELADQLDTFEIMLYRSLLGFIVVVGVAWQAGTLSQITGNRLGLHLIRNLSHFTGQNLWFYAVALIPLSQLVAFEFTTPLWVAVFAPLVLGERWTTTRVLACGIGFLGILIVARPDTSEINSATLAAVLCALGFAGATLATKRLSSTESVTCILFWLVAMQSVLGIIFTLYDGHITLLTLETLPWAILVGLTGVAAHFCITNALAIAPATVVMPLEFLRVPLMAVVGFWLYGEPLLYSVFIGALIILAANILNIRAETRLTQPATK
ncbi:MAG: drug/metabolite transporter (DMT)-like permease [Parasphingorhabdus sp.]|jgi:drug/metabolite transporter (DMT)-like permease